MIKSIIKFILFLIIGMSILISLTLIICKIGKIQQDKRFNNGICIQCGEKLEPFSVDKFGNVVWLCDDCGYNFITRRYGIV